MVGKCTDVGRLKSFLTEPVSRRVSACFETHGREEVEATRNLSSKIRIRMTSECCGCEFSLFCVCFSVPRLFFFSPDDDAAS